MKINNKNIKYVLTQTMARFGKELIMKQYNITQIYSNKKNSLNNLSFSDVYNTYELLKWKYIFMSICTEYITSIIGKLISDYCRKYNINENNLQKEMLIAIQKTSEKFTPDERCFIACKIINPYDFKSVKDVLNYSISNGWVNMYDVCDIINSLFSWEEAPNTPREIWEKLSEYAQPKLTKYFITQPIQKTINQIYKKYKI